MSKAIVQAVLDAYPDLIRQPHGEKFENMRRSLLVPVIDAMPGGRRKYGILKKTGSVPSDVITDLESATHDHIDVFSGTNNSDGTSTITANFQNHGDYRRHSAAWKREPLDKALAEGWIDPLPGTVEPPDPTIPNPGDNLPNPGMDHEARISAIEAWIRRDL